MVMMNGNELYPLDLGEDRTVVLDVVGLCANDFLMFFAVLYHTVRHPPQFLMRVKKLQIIL